MEYAMVTLPAAAMRRKADHRSEMVSQLLFGESIRILKEKGALWIKARSLHDNYEGWITRTLVTESDEKSATTMSRFVSADILGSVLMNGKKINIPFGSSLPFFELNADKKKGGSGKLGPWDYQFNGAVIEREQPAFSAEYVKLLIVKWLNTPYLWGGRTPLGVDCSGFVQVIFKTMGIDLPRDARQQVREGREVKKFRDILPGDLVFFDNKEDIVHVGILLDKDQIVHSSGSVRIDRVTRKRLIHLDTGKKGWRLNTIRRIV